jgi:hypothetical protein
MDMILGVAKASIKDAPKTCPRPQESVFESIMFLGFSFF